MIAIWNDPEVIFGAREQSSNSQRTAMSLEMGSNRKPAPEESLGGSVKHQMDRCDHI